MKKKFISAIAIVLLFSLLFMINGFASDNKQIGNVGIEKKPVDNLQAQALDAYQNLWDSFKKDESGNPIYPDEYGGEYIGEDNILYLYIVNATAELEHKYLDICKNSDFVKILNAEHSLNSLEALTSSVNSLLILQDTYHFVSFGADRRNNGYIITVKSESFDKLQADLATGKIDNVIDASFTETKGENQKAALESAKILRTAYDSGIVQIEIGEMATATASLIGGSQIWSLGTITGETSSIGIGGKYNTKDAIITCGHGRNMGSPVYLGAAEVSSKLIGTVVKREVSERGTVYDFGQGFLSPSNGDYSIVEVTNSSYAPTKTVYTATGTLDITAAKAAPVGTVISKYGYPGGYGSGAVLQVNQSILYDGSGDPIKYFYATGISVSKIANSSGTQPVVGGDSGGPVYYQDANGKYIAGFTTARNNTPQQNPDYTYYYVFYFTPITTITATGFRLN